MADDLTKATEDLLCSVIEFLNDWRKGDFILPRLAAIDAEVMTEKCQQLRLELLKIGKIKNMRRDGYVVYVDGIGIASFRFKDIVKGNSGPFWTETGGVKVSRVSEKNVDPVELVFEDETTGIKTQTFISLTEALRLIREMDDELANRG